MRRIQVRKKKVKRKSLLIKRRREQFIPTGCTLLNCAIGGGVGSEGGGWPLNRIINIVGDKSTGKTLLAIESVPNFLRVYPEGEVYYHEVEAAFDKPYAASLGMPVERVIFPADDEEGDVVKGDTVEDFFRYVDGLADKRIAQKEPLQPLLYILDSVDALSDQAEKKREIDEGTYGANKARQLSQVFRRLTKKLVRARVTLILISQIRAKLDAVSFGKKTTRSGGKALDFYASVIIELAEVKKHYKEVRGIKRATAIEVVAQVTKNKVGPPFRTAMFPVVFSYGIDDEQASFDWLRKQAKIGIATWRELDYEGKGTPTIAFLNKWRDDKKWVRRLNSTTIEVWNDIEQEFAPQRRKYSA